MVSPIVPVSTILPAKTGMGTSVETSLEKELVLPKEIYCIPVTTPEMSSALAAQVLGGSHIKGASLQGNELEGFSAIDFLVYLKEYMAQCRFKDVPEVGRVLSELNEMLTFESQLRGLKEQLTGASWGKRVALVANHISDHVKEMPVGKTLLFPGGWQGRQGEPGHAMLYRITRIHDTQFRFELYNTGAGLELHPQALVEDRLLYGQKMELVVSLEQMTDPSFWRDYYELYRESAEGSWPIKGAQLYHWLDKLSENFVEKAHQNTLSCKEMGLRRPQRAGNCTFECLLAYLKIQLQDASFEGESVYHSLKLDLQLKTLDSYWEFLDKQGISQPTPQNAQETLGVLGLLSKELQTVQFALAKEYKKRVKGGGVPPLLHRQIRAVQAKQRAVKAAKKECHRLLSEPKTGDLGTIKTVPITPPKCAPGHQIGSGFTLPKSDDSLPQERDAALLQWILNLNHIKPGRNHPNGENILFETCINRLPDIEDPFWDKHGKKAFPELLKWFCSKIESTDRACLLPGTYQKIKCLAILVRLAKRSDCPILSRFALDRRFITELILFKSAPLLMAPDIREAQALQKNIQCLLKNTEENGLFQEFCDPECQKLFLNLADKDPPKGSLISVVNTLFQDPEIYKRFHQEGRSRREAVKECLNGVSEDFCRMQQCVYHLQSHFQASKVWWEGALQPIWKNVGDRPDELVFSYFRKEKNTNALQGSFQGPDFDLFSDAGYALPDRFLNWLQPISEREIRSEAISDGVDVQFRLISSKDDPSLRIENLLELFSSHQELFQEEEYRKFFFVTLFQVSLKDGKIPLEEFLKHHPEGINLLTRFISQGVIAHEQDTEIAGFFFHVGLACAEYEQKILQKKELPFSLENLIRCFKKSAAEYEKWMRKIQEIESNPNYGLGKKKEETEIIDPQRQRCYRQQELLESYITRYGALVNTREVRKKIFANLPPDAWGGRINYPDWQQPWKADLGEACKGFLSERSGRRDKFFSHFVFGPNGQTRRWNYVYPYAYTNCGTWAINLEKNSIELQGCEIWNICYGDYENSLAVQKDPIWQQIVPDPTQLHFMGRIIGGGDPSGKYNQSLIFRDSRTGVIYRASFEKTTSYAATKYSFRFYQLNKTKWESIVSPSQVEDRGMLHRMGVDCGKGWRLAFDGLNVRIKDPEGKDRCKWDLDGLQDLSNGYFAADMQTEAVKKRYRTWIALDPRTQVWGKWQKGDDEDRFQPCAMACPTWNKIFNIHPDGTVHGTGDWEGFQILEEEHVSAIPGVFPILVLQHEKLGKRVVLPAGSMSSSKDLAQPMRLQPYQDVNAGCYEIALDKKGRLKPKTREEALYLANLFYHVHRPFAALRCLQQSTGSDPYSPKEWALLQKLLDATRDQADPHSLSLHLKTVWLMHNSQERPAKRALFQESTEHETRKKSIPRKQETLSFVKVFHKYLDQILHIPERLALSDEELAYFQQVCPKTTPSHIRFRLSLGEAGSLGAEESFTLEDIKKLYKKTWDPNLLQGKALPICGTFEEMAAHFLDFYAIVVDGSEQQKKQFSSWLSAVWALQNRGSYQKYDHRLILVSFFLRLLQTKGTLPSIETVQSWCEKKEEHQRFKKFLLDTLQQQLIKESPASVFVNSVDVSRPQTTSLRTCRLKPSHPPIPLDKSRLSTKTLQGLGTTPLSRDLARYFEEIDAPVTPKLPSIKISPLLSGTDNLGDAYKQAFQALEEGVEKYRGVIKDKLWVVKKDDIHSPQQFVKAWSLYNIVKKATSLFGISTDQNGAQDLQKEGKPVLYQALVQEKETCHNEFLRKKQQLLAKIRNPALSKKQLLLQDVEISAQTKAEFHWSDLLFLFAKRDANAYLKKQPHLTLEQAQSLYEETAQCLVEQVRLQRWEKALGYFDEKGELCEKDKAEELRTLLLEERTNYPLEAHPTLVLFEALSGIQLRPDQINNLVKLGDTSKDTLLEAIMGSGKSEVLIPLFAQAVADGEHLAIAVIPKELQGTTGSRLEKKLRNLFTQDSVQIHWEDVSLVNLQAIEKRLEQTIERRQVLRCYADEVQRFFLKEVALRYDYQKSREPAILQQLDCFIRIRKILKTKGVVLVDEAHQQLHRKRECRIALDQPVSISSDYFQIATDLQGILIEDPAIGDRFIFSTSRKIGKNAVAFVPEIHEKEWKGLLAAAFAKKRYIGREKEVVAFLLAESDKVPVLTAFTEKDRKKLAFARGQIQQILPVTLGKKHREDYGCFPPKAVGESSSLLAGPYRGLGRPVLGSSFASPDEVMAFTIQSYLIEGVPSQLMQKVIETLRAEARRRSIADNQDITATEEYQQYLSIIGGQAALERFPFHEPINYEVLVEELQQRPSALLTFVEKHVLPHVEQYTKTAIVNGLSFVRLFKTAKVVSGTFHGYFTLHHRFQKDHVLQPDIEAEAFVLLTRGQKPFVFTEKVEADEMLERIFTNMDANLRALVDQGALFQEVPAEVAKKILEKTKKNKQIQRVVYFEGDELRVLERGAQASVKYDPDRCPKETSFTFYDQVHATGTDIAQADDAEVLVTVSDTTIYADVIQAGFRARKLKFGQRCRFLVPFELTSALNTFGLESDAITSEEVLRYAKHIQAGMLQQENYKAVLEKLKECFLAKCQEWIDEDPDDEKLLQEILRDSVMDPERLYGISVKLEDPEKIFREYLSHNIQKLRQYRPKEDVSEIEKEMETIIASALPKDQIRLVPNVVPSQSREGEWSEVEVEQQQQQVVQKQQEQVVQQTLQRETLQELHVNFAYGQRNGSIEEVLFDPEKWARRLDLSHLTSPQFQIAKTPVADKTSPVYSVRDLLSLSKTPLPFSIDKLPKKLLFSLDVAIGADDEMFFMGDSLAMKHILLVPDPQEPNQPYQIVLSKREAELWAQAFKKEESELSLGVFAQACLFSPGLQAQCKLGRSACRKETTMDLSSLFTEASSSLSPFEKALVLAKWMMGEVRIYQKRELEYLNSWFLENATAPIEEVEQCFQLKFRHQWDTYKGSPLARLFSEAIAKQKPMDKPTVIPSEAIAKQKPMDKPTVIPSVVSTSQKESVSPPQQRSFLRIFLTRALFPIWLLSWPFRLFWTWLRKTR